MDEGTRIYIKNKIMKTIIKMTFLLFTLFTIGCSDPCDDVNCGTNGTCDEGTCICKEGFEGELCETEVREKFIGTFSGNLQTCLASIPGGEAIPSDFLNIQAVTSADPSDINQVLLNTPNPFLMLDDVSFNPNSGIFIIPSSTQEIEIPSFPLPININTNGNGQFIDENTLEITLSITVSIPLVPPINCTITMNKI